MSIKHVKGDILTTPTRNEDTVICHQVNCCGVMGAGLAKQIRDKWPVVFDEFVSFSLALRIRCLYTIPTSDSATTTSL